MVSNVILPKKRRIRHETGGCVRPVLTPRITGMSPEIVGLVLGQVLLETTG